MIATSVAYDIVFVVHVGAAIAVIVVFVTMRFAALGVASGAASTIQALRFPQRRNWAARVLHVLPVSGLVMSFSGGSSVALNAPWIGVGLFCYVAAAGHLEARTLPLERAIARTIASGGVTSRARGRQFVRSVDTLLALVAVALVAMLVQF